MKGFKAAVNFTRVSVRDAYGNITLYVFLCVVFFVIQFLFGGAGDWLRANGSRMNLWELYIWFMSTRQSQVIYLLGVIFLAGQAMNFHSESAYYLLRMDRAAWAFSRALLLLVHVVALNVFFLASFCIVCKGMVTIEGAWSEAAMTAARFSVEELGMRPVVSMPFGLLQSNPNAAGGLAFALAVLIGMFTGLLLMLFYMNNRPGYGIMLLFLLWFLDIVIESEAFMTVLEYMSPFGLSRLSRLSINYGRPLVLYAVLFLGCLTGLLSQLLIRFSESIDFIKLE